MPDIEIDTVRVAFWHVSDPCLMGRSLYPNRGWLNSGTTETKCPPSQARLVRGPSPIIRYNVLYGLGTARQSASDSMICHRTKIGDEIIINSWSACLFWILLNSHWGREVNDEWPFTRPIWNNPFGSQASSCDQTVKDEQNNCAISYSIYCSNPFSQVSESWQ